MKRKKLTTYDYLASKGKRQLSNIFCHSKEEAAAAEEAGIDFIGGAHDLPQHGVNATFEEIKRIHGVNESEVIKIMRKNLNSKSFKIWRERVTGRT